MGGAEGFEDSRQSVRGGGLPKFAGSQGQELICFCYDPAKCCSSIWTLNPKL